MHIFLSAFDRVPDPRAENARHDLGEPLVIAFVSVLCVASSCAEMSAFGCGKGYRPPALFDDPCRSICQVDAIRPVTRARPELSAGIPFSVPSASNGAIC